MIRFFRKLLRRRHLRRDLEAEIAFHREMARAAGNPIPFGNAGVVKEQAFDLWRFNGPENLWRDLVFATRALRKAPGFAWAALLSLGLGIGVNTAIFSLASEFLLSEPSVRDAGSVVYLQQGGDSHMQPAVFEYVRRSGVFVDVAGENEETFINFNNGAETQRIFAVQATRNYFSVLGIPLARGRGWTESDPQQVAVVSARFWRSRLGGDPAIAGRAIRLDGRPYTVLGVLPDNFRTLVGYGYSPDVYVPVYLDGTVLSAYACIKPGMTVGQLTAALPAVAQGLERELPQPEELKRFGAKPVAGWARLKTGKEGLTVLLFFVAVLAVAGLVLLIACVNVASLGLARAAARRQEIATRLALGASRGRLLQQLLVESGLLSVAGAALGFVLALVLAKAAAAVPLPFPVPIRLSIDPDWRAACYATGLAVFAALASGLAPAWQSIRESLAASMRRERKPRMRRALVIAQVAVSFLVLTAAALFVQNLARSSSLSPGFDTRRTIHAAAYLPPGEYKDNGAIRLYVSRAIEQLRAIPGVEAAAAGRTLPFSQATTFGTTFTFSDSGEQQHVQFNWNAVTPEFFRAMSIPLRKGRGFGPQDNGTAPVVIVNVEFVLRYLGAHEPVGATFTWAPGNRQYTIVGVAETTKTMTIGEDARAQVYEPFSQVGNERSQIHFVIRSGPPPATLLASVRRALRQVEPGAGLEVETMFAGIGFAFLPSQVGAALMGGAGALALLLTIIGVHGVLAYSIARRTREIGIRVAVGASPGHVARLVLAETAGVLAVGLAIGLPVALVATRPLAMFFVAGLSPSDPVSFLAVAAVFAATGAAAAIGPIRRALRVDSVQCLRCE